MKLLESILTYLLGGSIVDIAIRIGVIVAIVVILKYLISYVAGYGARQEKKLLDTLIANRNYLQAGNLYLKDGKPLLALKMFMQGRHWDRAAAVHAQLGEHLKAAELYVKVKDFENASRSYLKDEEYLKAADCLSRCEGASLRRKGAEIFESRKDYGRAAAVYEDLKEYEKASEMHRLLGEETRAHELMAASFIGKDDPLSAAASFVKAGKGDEALRLFEAWAERTPLSLDSVEGYYRYAVTLESWGRPLDALVEYDKIAKLKSGFRDVLIRMNNIRKAAGSPETVVATIDPGTRLLFAAPIQSSRYDIIKEIGRGGMGVVYEAMDTTLGRVVALKVLNESYASSPEASKYFTREAQSAAKLNHPSIVTVYDTGTLQGRHFISMEFVDGFTVENLLERKGKVPLGEFLLISEQILSGLAYAHAKNVIHRDIKPGNIMLSEGQVKIMDFGLAKVISDKQKTTLIAGTPQYMPLEQITGQPVDRRSDIFALGVSFFEMITGELPFPDGILAFPQDGKIPEPIERNSQVPRNLSDIISRMIQRTPDERYPSIPDVRRDMLSMNLTANFDV